MIFSSIAVEFVVSGVSFEVIATATTVNDVVSAEAKHVVSSKAALKTFRCCVLCIAEGDGVVYVS